MQRIFCGSISKFSKRINLSTVNSIFNFSTTQSVVKTIDLVKILRAETSTINK